MEHEADLIRQAREGSKEAFSQLVRLHQAHVRAFFGRYVRNWDVVEDLAQETFLIAYRGRTAYRGEAPLRAWLLGVARNLALKYLRDEGCRRSNEAESMDSALATWLARKFEADAADPAGTEGEVSALKACIQSLPRTSASLVEEHYFNSHSAVEIARRTGKKESSVWMALMRIRQALRRCIELRMANAGAERE